MEVSSNQITSKIALYSVTCLEAETFPHKSENNLYCQYNSAHSPFDRHSYV